MTDAANGEYPLEVDAVERIPQGSEETVVRVQGRWRSRHRPDSEQVVLVVEDNGRRHRFPALSASRRVRLARPGSWSASFEVPAWLASRLGPNAVLQFGEVGIPLPASVGGAEAAVADEGEPLQTVPEEEGIAEEPTTETQLENDTADPAEEPTPTHGPAEEGAAETVAALQAELHERTAAEVALRGKLADSEAELRARSAALGQLEATHTQLREQHDELRGLIERQRVRQAELEARSNAVEAEVAELRTEIARLRGELASGEVARQSAASEAQALRSELDRLGRELAEARERLAARDPSLNEAQALLAETRELRSKLLGEPESGA